MSTPNKSNPAPGFHFLTAYPGVLLGNEPRLGLRLITLRDVEPCALEALWEMSAYVALADPCLKGNLSARELLGWLSSFTWKTPILGFGVPGFSGGGGGETAGFFSEWGNSEICWETWSPPSHTSQRGRGQFRHAFTYRMVRMLCSSFLSIRLNILLLW